MIAAWMLYCSLCALGLSLAAVLAERLLLAGRAPVRIVWVSALTLSLVIPALVFRFSSSPIAMAPPPAVDVEIAPTAPVGAASTAEHAAVSLPSAPTQTTRDWRTVLPRLDTPLIVAWIALSTALALSFVGGIVALAWMRRRWERRDVQNTPLYVSTRTGPAVVGALSPAIVVPEWALALAPSQLGLMLRHEQEHLRARDGQLLIAAQIALIAMPWNLALWWQVLSLRVAVEMDCDERVLRHADARSYGELLLEVARPRRAFNLAGMIAFAERATQLERRIRVLKRHRFATSRRAAAAASSVALLALTAASVAPHPATPLSSAATGTTTAHATLSTLVLRDVPEQPPVVGANKRPTPTAITPVAQRTRRAVARIECANDTSIVGASYRFLFDSITLTRDNESKACDLLARLADEQLAEDAVAQASMLSMRARRASIQSDRDANLTALLRNEAERTQFAANVARPAGGVGRSGGAGGARMEGTVQPMQGGGGAGRVGRVGGGGATAVIVGDSVMFAGSVEARGRAGASDSAMTELKRRVEDIVRSGGRVGMAVATTNDGRDTVTRTDVRVNSLNPADPVLADQVKVLTEKLAAVAVEPTYERLFSGITLSPDDEKVARKLIGDAQQQMVAVQPTFQPGIRLRLNRGRGVAFVVAGADATLLDLVSNPADREKLRARIRVVPQ